MHGQDRLDAIAEQLYDAYASAASEAGWPNAASKLRWCQQPESIKDIWRRLAGKAIHIYAQEPHAN